MFTTIELIKVVSCDDETFTSVEIKGSNIKPGTLEPESRFSCAIDSDGKGLVFSEGKSNNEFN